VVVPTRRLASTTIDVPAILRGLFLPGSIGNRIAAAYTKHVFGDATLQDLPDRPRFVFNATSLQTGSSVRFTKPYLADYRVGQVRNPRIPVAVAVAASSAFPPFLSPIILRLLGDWNWYLPHWLEWLPSLSPEGKPEESRPETAPALES
jgi:NTE family protein